MHSVWESQTTEPWHQITTVPKVVRAATQQLASNWIGMASIGNGAIFFSPWPLVRRQVIPWIVTLASVLAWFTRERHCSLSCVRWSHCSLPEFHMTPPACKVPTTQLVCGQLIRYTPTIQWSGGGGGNKRCPGDGLGLGFDIKWKTSRRHLLKETEKTSRFLFWNSKVKEETSGPTPWPAQLYFPHHWPFKYCDNGTH